MFCEECRSLFASLLAPSVPFEPHVKGLSGDVRPLHSGLRADPTLRHPGGTKIGSDASAQSTKENLATDGEIIQPIKVFEDKDQLPSHSPLWWKVRLNETNVLELCRQPANNQCHTCSMMVNDVSLSLIEGLLRNQRLYGSGHLIYKLSNKNFLFHAAGGLSRTEPSSSAILDIWLQVDQRMISVSSLKLDASLRSTVPRLLDSVGGRTTASS